MSTFQTIGFLVSFAGLWFLYHVQPTCLRCGGRGGHRDDCPLAKGGDKQGR